MGPSPLHMQGRSVHCCESVRWVQISWSFVFCLIQAVLAAELEACQVRELLPPMASLQCLTAHHGQFRFVPICLPVQPVLLHPS